MSPAKQLFNWVTDTVNILLMPIENKKQLRRHILRYIVSIIDELSEEEMKTLSKDIKLWLINS